ncbi:SURF1 family protein [Acidovorax sp. DW039]|uniref:SURF1 family protein n=1 Tax=Acidovorax sp. DW039 TaxID=3095606 RepID=UPI0030916A2F|nr:SURF1 family protein [Acidovorax sp. DW039]
MTPRSRTQWVLFIVITVAAIAAMTVTAMLGRWQLGRAQEKLDYQAQIETRAAMLPLKGADLPVDISAEGAALLHRAVALEGRWLPEHTVYLDNRQMNGRPGFFVLTPLLLHDAPVVLLVQRGWIPRNFQDRTQLPQVETPSGWIQVKGRVAAAPSRLYELGAGESALGSSRIRQNLDLAAFRSETRLPLWGLTVVQVGEASEGLLRDWPVVASGVDKHYGYAFQWFGLCGLIALLYVWFQIIRRFVRPRRQRTP